MAGVSVDFSKKKKKKRNFRCVWGEEGSKLYMYLSTDLFITH